MNLTVPGDPETCAPELASLSGRVALDIMPPCEDSESGKQRIHWTLIKICSCLFGKALEIPLNLTCDL